MRWISKFGRVGVDVLLAAGAWLLAYGLLLSSFRFCPDATQAAETHRYLLQAVWFALPVLFLRAALFAGFGLYRDSASGAESYQLRRVALGVTAGTCVLVLWNVCVRLFPGLEVVRGEGDGALSGWIPSSVLVVDWVSCGALLVGARFFRRARTLARFNSTALIRNVVIVGTGEMGQTLARCLKDNPRLGRRPVGFVTLDDALSKHSLQGLPVWRGFEDLSDLAEEHSVAEVIVAMSDRSSDVLNVVVASCESAHVHLFVVPASAAGLRDYALVSQVRPVELGDLLGDAAGDASPKGEMADLEGQVVLVTGAGGTLGSALCRRILDCGPSRLVLLDRSASALIRAVGELSLPPDDKRLVLEVGDVQDVDRLERVFDTHRPAVVFHTAAHTHVDLIEPHPDEAVKNNVIGTFNVCFLTRQCGARKAILVSAGMAARPTCVVGASKRLAEMVLLAFSGESDETEFLAVRLGNLTEGGTSLVSTMRRQIAAGGPVVVAASEAERFFLSADDAATLLLEAAAIGGHGQVFLLDMGQPVLLADLARRLITLEGYEPDVDIEIEFSDGESTEGLYEDVLAADEELAPTEHSRIFAATVHRPSLDEMKRWIRRLDGLAAEGDASAIVESLREIVPDFHPARPSDVHAGS